MAKNNNQKKTKNNNQKKTRGRIFKGIVVSDKMDKTVVVEVTKIKEHPKYKKRYKVKKKYKAHDKKNQYKIGDKVIIQETRPISKHKKWKVIGLVES